MDGPIETEESIAERETDDLYMQTIYVPYILIILGLFNFSIS
jgi:hypothetical protein